MTDLIHHRYDWAQRRAEGRKKVLVKLASLGKAQTLAKLNFVAAMFVHNLIQSLFETLRGFQQLALKSFDFLRYVL